MEAVSILLNYFQRNIEVKLKDGQTLKGIITSFISIDFKIKVWKLKAGKTEIEFENEKVIEVKYLAETSEQGFFENKR